MSSWGEQGMIQHLQSAYAQERRLFLVHCDLLYQCDLDCGHCYLDKKGTRNRDTAFWKNTFDQMAELGAVVLLLSGGEIFLRSDILELVAHARSHGLIVLMKTHGGLIGETEARRLAELGVSEVQVSYYSPDPAVHDQITRRPGSHAATLKAMKIMAAHGLDVMAAFCAMGPNHDHLAATQAQCEDLGVHFKFSDYLFDGLNGSSYPRDLALTREQAMTVASHTATGEKSFCNSGALGSDWGQETICVAGHTNIYVDPEGRVTPCTMWQQPVGDLSRGDRLADIWNGNDEMDRVRAFRRQDQQGCSNCESVHSCNFCPGTNHNHNGDPMEPTLTTCDSSHAKATVEARLAGDPQPAEPPGLMRRGLFPIFTTTQIEMEARTHQARR